MLANNFRRPLALVLVPLALVAATGCADELDLDSELSPEVEEIIANLETAEFSRDAIEVLEDGTVVVEGDAVVTLEASRELAGMHDHDHEGLRQYASHNQVAESVEHICIDGSNFSGVDSTALDGAIDNYNGQNLSFSMSRFSGTAPGHCDAVITAYNMGGTGGLAGFPSNGLPYDRFYIGSGIAASGEAVVRHVIMHELGHAIGLRHSDWYNVGISGCDGGGSEPAEPLGANHIPNTPGGATWNGSVMNACYNSVNNGGEWTESDVIALQELYGTWYRLKSMWQGDGMCLQSNDPNNSGWHDGASYMEPCGNYSGQRWRLVEEDINGETWYRLKSHWQGEDMCLEGNAPDRPGFNGSAHMIDCNPVSGQLWQFEDVGGWYKMHTMWQGEGMCLESNDPNRPGFNGNAHMIDCNPVSGQYWELEEWTYL